MRILFPYLARWHSANWSRYHQLLNALSRLGHEVIVLQPPSLALAETNYAEVPLTHDGGPRVQEVPVPPALWQRRFPLEKLIKKGIYTLACRAPLREIIRQQRIDALLIYNLPQAILLHQAECARPSTTGCLRIFDIADDLAAMLAQEVGPQLGPLAHPVAALWQERLAASCDVVTVASETLKEKWPGRAVLIPNGVALDEVAAARGDSVRAQFRTPVVGYLGAFEYFVDMDLVLAAAARLPEVTFLLVGGGRDLTRVRQRVAREGLGNVQLTGPVSHAEGLNYVAAMDLCLVPFKHGPVADGASPLKLFEYAALHKPVISTPTAEVRHIAGDFAFFADTIQELTDWIGRLLREPGDFAARVDYGCQLVREKYAWDQIAPRFLDAVEEGRQQRATAPIHAALSPRPSFFSPGRSG
jgi:glycosyltransferase involved in cell wall biosynthesis